MNIKKRKKAERYTKGSRSMKYKKRQEDTKKG